MEEFRNDLKDRMAANGTKVQELAPVVEAVTTLLSSLTVNDVLANLDEDTARKVNSLGNICHKLISLSKYTEWELKEEEC